MLADNTLGSSQRGVMVAPNSATDGHRAGLPEQVLRAQVLQQLGLSSCARQEQRISIGP